MSDETAEPGGSPALGSYDAERLAALLAVLPDVDAVELKVTVPEPDRGRVLASLGVDPLASRVRQVAFVDTADLRLSGAGVVVRARRTQRRPGDASVKLRPMLPADLEPGLRQAAGFKAEIDASPQGYTCSCSLTGKVADRKVKALYGGERPLSRVLDERQLGLLTGRLPEGVALGDLRVLGPVHLLKSTFTPADYPRPMVAELWFLPDGARLLELSTRTSPSTVFQAAAETKVLLARHGVDLTAPQEAKTQATLGAFAARHGPLARPESHGGL